MIIPFIIMQAGIFPDYWGDFLDNAWSVHVHYWTGTFWYIYLIIQPYYATHGKMDKHRTNGIIGMFLAGGVSLTAFSMMYRDIASAERSFEMPESFGPFEPWFFYGVMAIEIPMIIAFGYAVIQSILKRKNLQDHAWWLISTVFIIMMPALSRGIQLGYIGIYSDSWPHVAVMPPIFLSQIIIIVLTLLTAWKYGKIKHQATYLVLIVNIYVFFLEPLGKSETLQAFFNSFIKG